MTAIIRWGSMVAMALLLSHMAEAQVQAVPAVPPSGAPVLPDRAAERERIHRERTTIEQNLQRAQADCYQRFAVEDCLRSARRKARSEQAVLRHQEVLMDEQDRRDRSAQRLQSIDERQRIRAGETPSHAVGIRASRGTVSTARPRAKPQEETRARQEQRRQALQRQAMEGRQNQAAKLQAAQERKARVQQRQAQDAARGRTPAAPLTP
jgi:hypothetical protein